MPTDAPVIRSSSLNPTDAALWDIERDPRLRTTIVAALMLERPVDRDHLANDLEAATRLIPRLRQRVVGRPGGVGTPRWQLDTGFDLAEHLTFVDAPAGVDAATLAAVAEPMASSAIDRSRPLWECTYVGGASGRAAILLKVHHSLTDGVGGVELLDVLLDRDPHGRPRDLTAIPVPRPGPRTAAGTDDAARAVRRAVRLPFDATAATVTTAFHPLRTAAGAWGGTRSAVRLLAPSSAPLSPLMVARGPERRIGTSEHDLRRMHEAAARHGCTVNQVFFAGVIGALAEYHRAHGRPVAELRVTMPVSYRRSGHDQAGNQWAPVRFVVPADVDDPVARMIAMRDRLVSARNEPALAYSQTLAGLVQVLPSALSSTVVSGMMHGIDLTLTNVPGLAEPHYICGAEVERIFAFAPTAGAALNVALVSHLDTACVGTLSDAAAVDDPQLLTELIRRHLDESIDAAERSTPARVRGADGDEHASPAGPRRADGAGPEAKASTAGAAIGLHRSPQRLSALDTAFLRLESPDTPMHIGGVFVLEGDGLRDDAGALRMDDARSHIEARLERVPRFMCKLSEVPLGLGRPLWVDDVNFDIERHVRVATVAPPGGRQQLLDLCAELFRQPLDRQHPLWELWFVDGLAGGGVGIVEKIHHAMIDGISGVELAAALFDLKPNQRPDVPRRTRRAPGPSPLRRLTDAVVEQITDPIELARRTASTVRSTPGQLVGQAASMAAATVEMVRPSALAPRTPFRHQVGSRRILRAITLDIDLVDEARGAGQATLNDVVLACIAGGVRHWLEAAGRQPTEVHVLVPVSTRRQAMTVEPGNRVGGVLLALPVAEPDRRRRLQLVQARMQRLKSAHEGEGAAALLDALDHVPAIGYGPLVRLIAAQPFVNFVVTNLPGPRTPLYFLGARVDDMIPVVPLGPNLGLGIAVLSYLDRLNVSLFADPDGCDDIDGLAAAIAAELPALVELGVKKKRRAS